MPFKLKPLHQQVVVVTGASSGNGLAITEAATRKGAAVVMAARSSATLEEIAARLRADGARIAICVADVAEDDAAERIAATSVEAFGGFDTWVNNAAAGAYGTLEQLSLAEHRRIMDVNYFGLLSGSLVAARHLRERGGAIINIGSVLGDGTMLLQGAYSASKHAVQAATEALRMELEEEGAPVSVTLIQPAAMHTPYPERARTYLNKPPRLPALLYNPRLVADAVLFAAQHRRRTLRVGSAGQWISIGRAVAPATSEWLLERFGRLVQVSTQRGKEEWRDALYQPRPAGAIEGSQKLFVRRQSYLLQAQKYPKATALLLACLGAVAIAAVNDRARRRQGH
ncbi:MAG TPA: SDR family oxidoreductase [Devosia sp.]|jgi:short-subunit dehydrogenase|uniref:SDR family oxidoreductase n=1 Tax=Devosia sp. TaxID=1871048 RepID=UPI002F955EF3